MSVELLQLTCVESLDCVRSKLEIEIRITYYIYSYPFDAFLFVCVSLCCFRLAEETAEEIFV